MATEDLNFASQQGTNYGNVCAEEFLHAFSMPRSDEFIEGWFETLTRSIEKSKASIIDRGGSENYVQAFVSALFATMNPVVEEYIRVWKIADELLRQSGK
jgi:hypothetical protein